MCPIYVCVCNDVCVYYLFCTRIEYVDVGGRGCMNTIMQICFILFKCIHINFFGILLYQTEISMYLPF